jgi:hypothetical protein
MARPLHKTRPRFFRKFPCDGKYFDSDAWLVLLSSMKSKKEQCTCPTCDTLISETVANFSTCKKWFHAVCEEATESDDLNKKQWHCKLKKNRSN